MANRWLGLCAQDERETLRTALRSHDANATLCFVDSALDLRRGVQETQGPVGAIVGMLREGVSAVNVAAALASDGIAQEVILVVRSATDDVRKNARKARVEIVIDADALAVRPSATSEQHDAAQHVVTCPVMAQPVMAQASHARPKMGEPIADLDEPDMLVEDLPTMVMLPSSSSLAQRVPHVCASQAPKSGIAASSSHEEDKRDKGIVPPWEDETCADARRAPMLAFVSGRGGVGKTSLVAAMATAAASWGMHVALLDLDLSAGNLYNCLGLPGPADLAPLAEQEELLREDIVSYGKEAGENIVLWGGCELPEMAESVIPKVGAVIATLRGCFDLVLVDTSVGLTDAVAQAAQDCDRLILVVDGRPGSTAAQRRLGALAVRLGIARTRMVRLANRCGHRGRGEPKLDHADVGLETARPLRVYEGGIEVSECMGEGKPADLFDLGSRFATSCASSLASLLSELGCLPNNGNAHQALEARDERPRWGFGRRKGAV